MQIIDEVDRRRLGGTVLTADGGTLTLTDTNGVRYSLVVPTNAVLEPAFVAMTPVRRLRGYPLDDTTPVAVAFEPEGLQLWRPATLIIEGPTPENLAEVTSYW